MFSRYKKPAPGAAIPKGAAPLQAVPKPEMAEAPRAAIQRKPLVASAPAVAPAADKEKKRKERMSEVKVELHKRLLENLNLAALESAREADLRHEIAAITNEALTDLSMALTSADRQALNNELYDEVMGLGPLEPLLKDETVNDILVNGRGCVETLGQGVPDVGVSACSFIGHLMWSLVRMRLGMALRWAERGSWARA